MGVLTAGQILGADDLPRKEVDVPEWGGTVYVRTMTGAEQVAWSDRATANGDTKVSQDDIIADLLVSVLVDQNGNQILSKGDAPKLKDKSAAVLIRLSQIAMKHNTITDDDIKEMEKNLEAAPSG